MVCSDRATGSTRPAVVARGSSCAEEAGNGGASISRQPHEAHGHAHSCWWPRKFQGREVTLNRMAYTRLDLARSRIARRRYLKIALRPAARCTGGGQRF